MRESFLNLQGKSGSVNFHQFHSCMWLQRRTYYYPIKWLSYRIKPYSKWLFERFFFSFFFKLLSTCSHNKLPNYSRGGDPLLTTIPLPTLLSSLVRGKSPFYCAQQWGSIVISQWPVSWSPQRCRRASSISYGSLQPQFSMEVRIG